MLKMWKIYLLLAVLIVNIAAQQQSKYGKSTSENDKLENSKTKGRGIGISAWGLVFLIVAIILLGAAAYYIVIFYPFLCKEERRYNRIELATM